MVGNGHEKLCFSKEPQWCSGSGLRLHYWSIGPWFESHYRHEALGNKPLCPNYRTSPHVLKGYLAGREGICVCVACHTDLEP
jgi:hypothetical protein